LEANCGLDGGPNGLFVSEDGVEEPDLEGTGGGGGEGFVSQCWEAESLFEVLFVGGVPTIAGGEATLTGTLSEFVAEVTGVGSPGSPKPQASSTVSLTGDTIDELEPLAVWRIGCWLVEGVIWFNDPNEFVDPRKERVFSC